MIGLVVVTHGRLAEEFISAAEHVVGRLENVAAICIGPDDDMDMRRREIIAAAKETDTGAGVVILTDMFGGTPSNLAISVMGGAKIEVIAGVNLPLLKFAAACHSPKQPLPHRRRAANTSLLPQPCCSEPNERDVVTQRRAREPARAPCTSLRRLCA
jgi:PTS system mannose-specific IIA component